VAVKEIAEPTENSIITVFFREHVFRRHRRLDFSCPRCFELFPDQHKLNDHIRARPEDQCDISSPQRERECLRISYAQEKKLQKRPKNLAQKERWIWIFQILFPDIPSDQIPSPCKSIAPLPKAFER